MNVLTYSDARATLKDVLDRAQEDNDITVIARKKGSAVVMSLDHYNGLLETVHLLSSPANVAHLERSITQHQAGTAQRRKLIEE